MDINNKEKETKISVHHKQSNILLMNTVNCVDFICFR